MSAELTQERTPVGTGIAISVVAFVLAIFVNPWLGALWAVVAAVIIRRHRTLALIMLGLAVVIILSALMFTTSPLTITPGEEVGS
jgi:hypothetical protein